MNVNVIHIIAKEDINNTDDVQQHDEESADFIARRWGQPMEKLRWAM